MVSLFAAGNHIDVPAWTLIPFLLMLLAIAVAPIFMEHYWHKNRYKLLVSLLLSIPIIGYLYFLETHAGKVGLEKLHHALEEYVDFIVLLGSLYTISGGIYLQGSLRPGPFINSFFLLIGAVLANFIGTTGASMVLIRPLLRMNARRKHQTHLVVFFIFVVSNLGGLLTPLGDPPLFLGFKRGVDFFWTLQLWQHWCVAIGAVMIVFFIWDVIAFTREPKADEVEADENRVPLRLYGWRNIPLLAGVIAGVLMQSDQIGEQFSLERWIGMKSLAFPWGSAVLVLMALLSLVGTPRDIRRRNDFSWGAMIEVAVLFLGIFITMVPALEYLGHNRSLIPVHSEWQFFWVTGTLSSFLDNAPTYLTFATIAAGSDALGGLMNDKPGLLMAISAGAVFMGANTYIGNGPNFMVKAIAESMKVKAPSFFGYMLYSTFILLPIFLGITWLFFW
jgi:Na+/H+ antiporter NhaD/arsenite permease-like protein